MTTATQTENPTRSRHTTTTERASDHELVVTRRFDAPAPLVFEAWTTPELLQRWWAPESFQVKFVSCEADVRTGGRYRFVMSHPSAPEPMAFFGRYLEVVPARKIVWTNEEGEGEAAVTTVMFEERDGGTLVTVRDRYPTKEALDEAIASGSTSGWPEQFNQLDMFLATPRGG